VLVGVVGECSLAWPRAQAESVAATGSRTGREDHAAVVPSSAASAPSGAFQRAKGGIVSFVVLSSAFVHCPAATIPAI
jgi:hypothetical protein